MSGKVNTSWARIILAVRSPLGLAALMVLVLAGVLLILAQKVQGIDVRIFVVGVLILLLISLLLAFTAGARVTPINPEFILRAEKVSITTTMKYDAFLSVPMAALGDEEYKQVRQFALDAKKILQSECRLQSVFYAGDSIDTKSAFDPNDTAVLQDFRAISESHLFILLLPKKTASSVLFEAGVALGLGKNCVYFVKDRKHLPFLMRQAELAFENVKVYEYKAQEDLRRLFLAQNTFDFAPSQPTIESPISDET